MPHYGLINEDRRHTPEYSLLRSRIHVRTARRQLGENKLQAGIGVYYDALHYGVVYYAKSNYPQLADSINLENEFEAFDLLKREGVLPSRYVLKNFEKTMEAALEENYKDYHTFVQQIDTILTTLGVLPCNFEELPPEPAGIH